MARVFTITEGLENLGALKTGGQGSVYKGKRLGDIFSAIKILPTPIYSESNTDKNYASFQSEVQKLKKVNEKPNPHVVRILSAGITESGNLPFIEMEYIEGPDLSELLKPPHNHIFSLKEIIKVSEQLAHAIAHCHQVGIKHGDIKTNNVKFNNLTGNYMLLDFGLSVMTDEQRRTSFRHAGAIEFMAPEQNEGSMLFETDVYSFGVIIFELIAGSVPFPLKDNGETSRNAVMIAHMETLVPDMLSLRKNDLPASWEDTRKIKEMQVPQWLISMINTCLKKDPSERFKNGMELYDFICDNASSSLSHSKSAKKPVDENEVLQYKQALIAKDHELEVLRNLVKEKETVSHDSYYNNTFPKKKVSRSAFLTLLIITFALAGFAAYTFYQNNYLQNTDGSAPEKLLVTDTTALVKKEDSPLHKKPVTKERIIIPADQQVKEDSSAYQMPSTASTESSSSGKAIYKVNTIAHFYDRPDDFARRNSFLSYKDVDTITALDESGDYIYIELETAAGVALSGWLRKSDLKRIN
ncbi:MAG: serine/threonine-protein kinase [Ferruginibacter sp.]